MGSAKVPTQWHVPYNLQTYSAMEAKQLWTCHSAAARRRASVQLKGFQTLRLAA